MTNFSKQMTVIVPKQSFSPRSKASKIRKTEENFLEISSFFNFAKLSMIAKCGFQKFFFIESKCFSKLNRALTR